MNLRKHRTLTRFVTVLLAAVLPAARSEAQTSGKVGAVNQDATGTPPGAASRTLVVGTGVVYKERIKTSPQGSTQILFPDQSTLNIGRNSSLVIDEYVYSPKTGTGTMLASLGKGALRFVGGQISHTKGVTINSPVGSLGIRGGIASMMFPVPASLAASDPSLAGCADGELVIAHAGIVKLKNKVSAVLIRPGFAACVDAKNDAIARPFRVSDDVLAIVVADLTSGPGQTGGVVTEPIEPLLVRNAVGTVILTDPANPPGSDPLGYVSILGIGSQVVKSKSQATQTQQVVAPPAAAIPRPQSRPAPPPSPPPAYPPEGE